MEQKREQIKKITRWMQRNYFFKHNQIAMICHISSPSLTAILEWNRVAEKLLDKVLIGLLIFSEELNQGMENMYKKNI